MKGKLLKNLIRDPKIIWRVEKLREAQVAEAMVAGEEPDDQGTVILIVAGTMHQLNYVGGSIWQLCDGSRDIDAVVTALLDEFDVDRDELAADVEAFVEDLIERGWLLYGE